MQADVKELEDLERLALAKHKSRKKSSSGLDRFSTVALEYSKLLDVVMNQCPEYVALAWGVIKLLLVASINHSKLKENVESHLISIGGQLGIVNQLMAYSPTDNMVEAVALLYESFSKFLGKALRCYTKSKLASVIDAFGFPWEAKFQKVVTQIESQVKRIQEISTTNHFHATLKSQQILHSMWECQQSRGPEQLRDDFKEELKREMFGVLQSFDTKWVQRFDDLLLQRTVISNANIHPRQIHSTDPCQQRANQISIPQIFLADFVSSHERLLEFRNMSPTAPAF